MPGTCLSRMASSRSFIAFLAVDSALHTESKSSMLMPSSCQRIDGTLMASR